MTTGFWKLPTETIKTPLSIMKEQGSLLTSATKGVLVGHSSTSSQGTHIFVLLSIVVPALNNYKVDICQYVQPLAIYPGTLRVELDNVDYNIPSEERLVTKLAEILGSDKMQRILSSLYSQAAETSSKS